MSSNHSSRKTSVTLLSNDVHPLIVSQLSGYKRVDGLNSYYVASNILDDSSLFTSSDKMPTDVENSMMQDWDDFAMPPAAPTRSPVPASPRRHNFINSVLYGAFPGASYYNFTINIYNGNHEDKCNQSPVKKRRRIIIDED